MPKIRSIKDISGKWATVTPQRTSDYESGIKAPLEDWAQKTSAAEAAYESGVQAAIADKRFGKGVKEAGTEKWQRKAIEVGINRWGPGVRAAQADYESGFSKYRDVIERLTLPPRYPKGDPRNIDRVAAIAKALHEAKIK